MLGLNNQVWVTSALTDEEVRNALVLCYSLKRAFSSRRVAVIASPKISKDLRQKLYYAFDLVFTLEVDQVVGNLKLEDFAKLSVLPMLKAFDIGAYLAPNTVCVKNPDDIFEEYEDNDNDPDDKDSKKFEDFVFTRDMDLRMFLFKPDIHLYEDVTKALKQFNTNGKPTDFEAFLKLWKKTKGNTAQSIPTKYCQILEKGRMLLGDGSSCENDMALVSISGLEPVLEQGKNGTNLDKLGLLGKCVLDHWLNIYNSDVKPLMEAENYLGSGMMTTSSSLSSIPDYKREPIAIVGMSCRFPGSSNLEQFWNLLFNQEDGTGNPPPFRWLNEQCVRPRPDCRKTNAGFIPQPVDEFDAKFFGVSPKEVMFMDPQHRLLHELVWEGLEDACIDPETLRGKPGSVFIGSWTNDYRDILAHSGNAEFYRGYMGNSIGAAAARISHLLELVGPSVATESGCSSAIVALHLACRSLLLGESNMSLACGVNLLLHPFDLEVMPMVLSPEGHCKTFSENADGFARAEGCGVLVLKRLSDAVRDGDKVWALIRGSAVAQEGISKSMGTPTVKCESLAMSGALRDAQVRPEEVSYVEAHGTGTVVGDPMEVAAIAKAYRSPLREEPLIIGSVKTNVGHTESCSGITGIMKVVLAMHHEVIPAHRNFTKLNPAIDLTSVPARIPLEPIDWKRNDNEKGGRRRLAGVSSFGITGTDAHVIVEESPKIPPKTMNQLGEGLQRPLHILKLSAKTDEAMDILLERYQDHLQSSSSSDADAIEDMAYAGNIGRSNFNQRLVLTAKTKEELLANLQQNKYLKGEVTSDDSRGKICFLFTGQGSQYPGMAKELYETSPVFRLHFDLCDDILKDHYQIDIKSALWGSSSDQIARTIYSQTSIFAVEYALLRLWESWGVKPDFVLGHSLGEFGAAVCAGLLNVEEALKLVAERSRLIDKLPRGKMLVIKADQQRVEAAMKHFGGKALDYAAVNSGEQTVVAGDSDVILGFADFCKNNGLKSIVLEATHAFHSSHMNPILEEYGRIAATVGGGAADEAKPKCEYISGMLGRLTEAGEVDAGYWVQHTREKVSFLEASKKAVELGCRIFIEVGPQPVLSALTMMNNDLSLVCLPSLKKSEQNWVTLLDTVGKLYLKGVPIDWNGFDRFYPREKCRLPHYPFIGKKFWPDLMAMRGTTIHPLLGASIPNASSTKLFQCGVNLTTHEFIKDHAIGTNVVFPGAGYLEMILAAGMATVENAVESLGRPSRPMKVEGMRIEAPLALQESRTSQLQTVVDLNTSQGSGDWNDMSVKIFQRVERDSMETSWLSHAKAIFSPLPTAEEQIAGGFDLEEFQEMLKSESDDKLISQVYDKLGAIGLNFGEIFRSLQVVWKKKEGEEKSTKLLAKVKIPPKEQGQCQYILHPAVIDAMIQSIMMLRLSGNLRKKLYVPITIGKFVWLAENQTEEAYILAHDDDDHAASSNGGRRDDDLSTVSCSAVLLDGNGKPLAIMSGAEFIDTTVRGIEAVLEQQTISMPDMWEEVWRGKMGPLQYTQNVELCNNKEKFFDEEFREDMIRRFDILDEELSGIFQELERLVYLYMLRALYECGWEPNNHPGGVFSQEELFSKLGIRKEFSQYFGYCLDVFQDEGLLKPISSSPSSSPPRDGWEVLGGKIPKLDEILRELSSAIFTELHRRFPASKLFSKVGEILSGILKGEESPLHLLFPEDPKKNYPSVGDYYVEYGELFKVKDMGTMVMTKYMDFCKEQHKGEKFVLRVLEVGAGTGVFTSRCLEILEKVGVEVEYTYTDISAAFFGPAEKKLERWGKQLQFKKLNIEEDPLSQGFTPGYYDMVCASDVVHATKDIRETLGNVRILLKPLGRFEMVEMTKVNRFVTYLFGLLEGFWRFEDRERRPKHCTLTTEGWREALEESGFEMNGNFPAANGHHSFICGMKRRDDDELQPKLEGNRIWLVFHLEGSPVSEFLRERIPQLSGRRVLTVKWGERFGLSGMEYTVRRDVEGDYVKVMEEMGREGYIVEGIVYCWGLDGKAERQEDVLRPYFYLIKSTQSLKRGNVKLIVLTKGIAPIGQTTKMDHFHKSTLWGMTKSLRNEDNELTPKCIDIGEDSSSAEDQDRMLMEVFYEIWKGDKDTQVAYREGLRYVPKFQVYKPIVNELKLPSGTDRFQLVLPETKSIGDLEFGPLEMQQSLGEAEVEIQVKASALNFKDVLNILKPTEEFQKHNAVGFDLAGVVKRIGAKVTKWKVGDEVFGINIHGSALPSHVILGEDDVLEVGEEMTFCEAATIPAVFATAYHCLIDVAKVTKGDIVLIHTASGGVGLSAIQICRHLGAKIVCTAGSHRKQNYLRGLGIQNIFHSRSTNYGEEILELTGGRGVDVVLNSLTSEGFKEATLMACAKNARFVEMSKLSIWTPAEVQERRPDVDYTIVDVSALDMSELRRLMRNIKELADASVVTPIPYVRFDGLNIREALHYLQKAKHVGKIVCVMPEVKQEQGKEIVKTQMFNSKSTYLITGGLGGIGFLVCQWMVENGARFVVLAGRSPPSPSVELTISQLNSQFNGKVTPVKLDVSDFAQCQDLIQRWIPEEMGYPPLRGVMHCAGTLQDGLIQNQDWAKLSLPFKTKVEGTLNLHELTKGHRMEHFVLFSSVVSLMGSPGQSNHAAANNFEDTFAHYRHSVGLPATSINWGQWGQVGVATEVEFPGLRPMSNLHGLAGLEHSMKSQRPQTAVINIDSFVLLSKLISSVPGYLDERMLNSRGLGGNAGSSNLIKSEEFWEQYDSKTDHLQDKIEFVQDTVRIILRGILKLEEGDPIQEDQNFQEMGVDSLMFVEIKNSLQAMLGDRLTVNASSLRDCNTLKLLSETLVGLIEGDMLDLSQPPTSEEVVELIREDCQLPEETRAKEGQIPVDVRNIKCVLVTGATGTLGPYMLKELTKLEQISRVICLLRPSKRQSGEDRLRNILEEKELLPEVDMSKISVVSGDVVSSQLGMEDSKWAQLSEEVDAIIHLAASVQHVEHYRRPKVTSQTDMRTVNILGTKRVLELACSGSKLKQVYFASTMTAIPSLDEEGRFSENWPEDDAFDGLTTVAYPITKFVGDVLMKKAILERGIPGKVFRLPFISGDSKTGRFVLNQNHAMLRYLFILKTGLIQSSPFPVHFIPVDVCAQVTTKLFLDERCGSDIFNVAHNQPNIDQEFVSVAEKLGYDLEIVEFAEFAKKVRETTVEDSPFAIFKELYRDDTDLMGMYTTIPALRQWLEQGGNQDGKFFESRKIMRVFPEFYEGLEPSMDNIYRDILFARGQGWLKSYGLK